MTLYYPLVLCPTYSDLTRSYINKVYEIYRFYKVKFEYLLRLTI